jgi:hypothetical protein
MVQQPAPQPPSHLTPSTGTGTPNISSERQETLKTMRNRIDAFAQHLFAAHKIFRDTRGLEAGSQEAKASLFAAKQYVESARHELDSTVHLISLAPPQVSHIATPVHQASHQLARIIKLTERLLFTERTAHYDRALEVLALACPRASYPLENSLNEPLKQSLRGNLPPPPGVTS